MNTLNELVNLDLVYDNEWFDKYSNIINNGLLTYKKYYQKHHIIPKNYYKYNNMSVDNSKNNVIYLKIVDHVLAHYYLILCAKQEWFKISNVIAFIHMTNEYDMSIGEQELIKKLDNYEKIYKQYVDNQSEKARLRIGINSTTGGRIAIYNENLKKTKFIRKEDLNYYMSIGYRLGGHPMSEDAKKKIGKSNSISLKGCHRSEEARQSTSESLRKKWADPNNNWFKSRKKKK